MASEWRNLLDRAFQKKAAAELLASNEMYEEAMEAWHLACELLIKSSIARHGYSFAATHDLDKLVNKKYGNRKFLWMSIKGNANANRAYTDVMSAWNVNMRYSKYPASSDIEELLDSYEVLFLWTENNLMTK